MSASSGTPPSIYRAKESVRGNAGGRGSGSSSHSTPTGMTLESRSSPSTGYTRSRPRPPSWDSCGGLNPKPAEALPKDGPPTTTVKLPRTSSHSQLLELLVAPAPEAGTNSTQPAPPPYTSGVSQGSSPTKRPIPRVPAPEYRSESDTPEVWPLTRELVTEFKEYTRGNSGPIPTMSNTLLNTANLSDRTRRPMSYQVLPGHGSPLNGPPNAASTNKPVDLLTPTSSPPTSAVKPAQPTPPGRSVSDRPLPNPPTANNPQARTQPLSSAGTTRLSHLLGLPPSDSEPAPSFAGLSAALNGKRTAGVSSATTSSFGNTATAGSGRSGAGPFRFDTAPQRAISLAASGNRETQEHSSRPVDDRDEVDEDGLTEKEGNGWHVVSETPEDLLSPLASSVLIHTEPNETDQSINNTPRSPTGPLPVDQGPNSLQQLLMALQLGAAPLPAPVPTYPPSQYAPTYPSLVPFELYPSREPSVAGPSMPMPMSNEASYARPHAPKGPNLNDRYWQQFRRNATPMRPAPSVIDSVASTPYPGPWNPFLPFQYPASVQSSPSHIPLPLDEPRPPVRAPQPRRNLRQPAPSESGESTQPQETESEGEDNEDDVWVDEPSDDDLGQDFHPEFIANPRKRRQKFEQKYRSLVKQFRELDNMTDSTMFLLLNNPDQRHTHLVLSRSVMKDEEHMCYAQSAQQSFAVVAERRRQQRAAIAAAQRREEQGGMTDEQRSNAAFEQLANLDVNAIDGEDNLKNALDFAITSLKQLHDIYEEREQRRQEEQDRQRQEQANIAALLQYLGLNAAGSTVPQQ